MESLVKPCQSCHKPMNGGVYRAPHICPHCLFEHEGGKSRMRSASVKAVAVTAREPEQLAAAADTAENYEAVAQQTTAPEAKEAKEGVVLTSKSADEYALLEIIDELVAECALNIELTPDLFKDGKFIGTKSNKIKAAFVQAKKHALSQLRQEAQEQGANIVTDVAVKNTIKGIDKKNARVVVKATGTSAFTEQSAVACEV